MKYTSIYSDIFYLRLCFFFLNLSKVCFQHSNFSSKAVSKIFAETEAKNSYAIFNSNFLEIWLTETALDSGNKKQKKKYLKN